MPKCPNKPDDIQSIDNYDAHDYAAINSAIDAAVRAVSTSN